MKPRADDTISFRDTDGGNPAWSDIVREAQHQGLLGKDVPACLQDTIREEQIARLTQNVALLKAKQEEFNRKIEVYTTQIENLVASLTKEHPKAPTRPDGALTSLHVRCVGCGRERAFLGYTVVKAFEPEQCFEGPTEFWIETPEGIRRGKFSCPECGSASLTIKAEQ